MTSPSLSEAPTGDAGIVAVVGNPQPQSRTASLAAAVATALSALSGHPQVDLLDLAALSVELGPPLGPDSGERWAEPLARIHAARVLVVATPVYKGSYTGLLKSLLDHVGGGALRDIVAVPVITVGSPAHSLALDVHLRPLLLELGASTPTSGLVVVGSALDDPVGQVDAWVKLNERVLRAALGWHQQPLPA